MRTKPV